MEIPIKFYYVKGLVDRIDTLNINRKKISDALKSTHNNCIINYGVNKEVFINDQDLLNEILNEELFRIDKRLQELLDELENLK